MKSVRDLEWLDGTTWKDILGPGGNGDHLMFSPCPTIPQPSRSIRRQPTMPSTTSRGCTKGSQARCTKKNLILVRIAEWKHKSLMFKRSNGQTLIILWFFAGSVVPLVPTQRANSLLTENIDIMPNTLAGTTTLPSRFNANHQEHSRNRLDTSRLLVPFIFLPFFTRSLGRFLSLLWHIISATSS